MKKGEYVNRSTYQKVAEENKKLRKHIAILVEPGEPSFERFKLVEMYRKKIAEDEQFWREIKELLTETRKMLQECGGAKCQIPNCPICKNDID